MLELIFDHFQLSNIVWFLAKWYFGKLLIEYTRASAQDSGKYGSNSLQFWVHFSALAACFLIYKPRLMKPACLTGLLKVLRKIDRHECQRALLEERLSESSREVHAIVFLSPDPLCLLITKSFKRIIYTHQLHFSSLTLPENSPVVFSMNMWTDRCSFSVHFVCCCVCRNSFHCNRTVKFLSPR